MSEINRTSPNFLAVLRKLTWKGRRGEGKDGGEEDSRLFVV